MAGIYPNIGVLCSELFPTEIRATSSGIVRALSYIALMVNYKLYPMAMKSFGLHNVVYYYAGITAVFTIWVFLAIKNTDRLSLIEIQDMNKKTGVSGFINKNKDESEEKEEGIVGNGEEVRINVQNTSLRKRSVLQVTETEEKEERLRRISNAVEVKVDNDRIRKKSVFQNWKPFSNASESHMKTRRKEERLEANVNKVEGTLGRKRSVLKDWKTISNAIDVR